MFIDPHIGESLQINGKSYTFSEAPNAPGIIYAEIGRKAKVYRVINGGQSFALKAFKPKYRSIHTVENSQRISQYQNVPGLSVSQRHVITAKNHPRVIGDHPDFEFGILMPWVEGKSWFNYVTGKVLINRRESICLTRALINIIYDLERHDLAHCDLSSSNFIFSSDFSHVELIDIEDMFGYGLQEPAEKPKGTGGYSPNWASADGIWEAGADRFSTAILVCEILGWQFENIREASDGDAYFAEGEFGNKSRRFRLLSERLEQIQPELANLFKTVWYSESLEECPKIAKWKEIVDTLGEPELEIAPSVIDFGSLQLECKGQLPTRKIKVRNTGSGTLTGSIISNVNWLSITPKEFANAEGSYSEHSVTLLANYPDMHSYKSQFDDAIHVYDGNSTQPLSCKYEITKKNGGTKWLWVLGGAISFLAILIIILSQMPRQTGGFPSITPPTSEVPSIDSSSPSPIPVQEAPTYTTTLQYSSNLDQWNITYFMPVGIDLSQTKSSNDWIEPQAAGNQRFFGILHFGENTQVGVILDVLDQVESRMIFSFDGDVDFSDNSILMTSDQVISQPVEFQITYSDGSAEPYAIKAYYLTDRAPGELLYYRASLREGTIQLPDQTLPIAIFDDNADGLYSDLENIEVKVDLNLDGFVGDDERFYAVSPIKIADTYYKVAEISPSGVQITLQEAQFGQVIGTINDATSGKPISNAQITTYPLGLVTVSNTDGYYSLQVPEGNYWQFAILSTGYVPEYVYPQEPVAAGQALELNISLSQPSGLTHGTVQLHDGDSYHFLAGTTDQYSGGDFYFSFSDDGAQFLANNYYQQGLIDLGFDPNIELDRVEPPDSGYYQFGVDAIIDHVYVSLAKEGETGHYVIFRVTRLEPGQYVEIEYHYD